MEACSSAAYNYQDSADDEGVDGACRTCRNEHCCFPLTTCLEDADCEEALECYATCADAACMVSTCNNAAHGPLTAKIAPDWACRSRHCLAECDGTELCTTVFYWSDPECRTCVHDSCCAQTRACSEDAECLLYVLCQSDCDDAACREACDHMYSVGAGLDHARAYCMASDCSAACSEPARTCGGFSGMEAPCETCLHNHCCAEGEACGTSAECAAVHICMGACGADTVCQDECVANGTAEGVALYQALTTCQAAQCATYCGG
jgi:hypothetical protein